MARNRKPAAESNARIEAEIRAVALKMSHRPVAEIVQYLRESRSIAADPEFIRAVIGKPALVRPGARPGSKPARAEAPRNG